MRKRAIWFAVIVHSLALLSCQFPPSSNDFQYYQCTITSFIDAYKLKFPDRFWGTWASGIPHSYGETWVLSASNGVQTEDASGNVLENWQDEISKILLGYSLKRIEITIDGNTATLVFTSDFDALGIRNFVQTEVFTVADDELSMDFQILVNSNPYSDVTLYPWAR